jgi:hypothetical protein
MSGPIPETSEWVVMECGLGMEGATRVRRVDGGLYRLIVKRMPSTGHGEWKVLFNENRIDSHEEDGLQIAELKAEAEKVMESSMEVCWRMIGRKNLKELVKETDEVVAGNVAGKMVICLGKAAYSYLTPGKAYEIVSKLNKERYMMVNDGGATVDYETSLFGPILSDEEAEKFRKAVTKLEEKSGKPLLRCPSPDCLSRRVGLRYFTARECDDLDDGYAVVCGKCQMAGPIHNDDVKARELWNGLPRHV